MTDYSVIVNKICVLFKNECPELYFYPKSSSNKNAGGCLYNAVKFRCRKLKQDCNLSRNRSRENKNTVVNDDSPADEGVIEHEHIQREEIRKKLVARFEPWQQIRELWIKTFDMRRSEIELADKSLTEFIHRWPKYKDVRGMEMVSFG